VTDHAELERDVRWLKDRAQIVDLVHAFAIAADQRDWERFRNLFDEKVFYDFSTVHHSAPRMRYVDEWIDDVIWLMDGLGMVQHFVTDIDVSVNGDEASCVAYLLASHLPPSMEGEPYFDGGRYEHSFIRTAAGWKYSKVSLVKLWETGEPEILATARSRPGRVKREYPDPTSD
jgi:hypothetical protein